MRYDTMLATAMSIDAVDAGGRVAQWRQLVDLIVQARGAIGSETRARVFERIATLRASVPVEQRRLAAQQLATRAIDVDSVALFATDEPMVAAPVLAAAVLDGMTWQRLIAQLPPASRALLRNRRDLPEAAVQALAAFGLTDFALPANAAAPADAGAQIRDLVARIEAFRRNAPEVDGKTSGVGDQAEEFSFETSITGLIDWVSEAPREALIGLSIAEIAEDGGMGVDGQAAGAFRRRAPFRDARLAVAGESAVGGAWLISATPVFNPRDGRFAGYHGEARRPRADEIAGPFALFSGSAQANDGVRQLIHELRTPLNAILGFAEMIERQLLGPAALSYRSKARAILSDGHGLLELVDDLDQAGRIEPNRPSIADVPVDAKAALARIVTEFQPVVAARQTPLHIDQDDAIRVLSVNVQALERLMKRLIGAALGLAQAGETLPVALYQSRDGSVQFSVGRPRGIRQESEADLLDPSSNLELPYPDAPLLGLGFSLRLVRALAQDLGGRFTVSEDAFVVTLRGEQTLADLPAATP